jgi:hypothetical protein
MPNHDLGYQASGGEDGDVALSEIDAIDTALRGDRHGAAREIGAPEPADQVALDIAEIERAAATLRRAQPALEAWTTAANNEVPAATPRKPRPVWVLIGLLWLSTALVAASAFAVVARLAG